MQKEINPVLAPPQQIEEALFCLLGEIEDIWKTEDSESIFNSHAAKTLGVLVFQLMKLKRIAIVIEDKNEPEVSSEIH